MDLIRNICDTATDFYKSGQFSSVLALFFLSNFANRPVNCVRINYLILDNLTRLLIVQRANNSI